jgi:hypothetical protein
MTESGLRKRPTSSAVPTKGQKGATGHSNNGNDDSEPEPDASTTLTSTTAATDSPSTHRNPISVIFSVLLHLAAISAFVMGFILWIQLHMGEECDMTYSMR